jgi:archaemetzincin
LTENRTATILIAPIGDFDADILAAVADMIPRHFALPCRLQPLIDSIDFAWDAKRGQFHSTAILDELTAVAPPDGFKIVALTHHDLFIPILTHVYGEAQLGGTSCIISTCRLGDGISAVAQREIYLARIVKESAHELGHAFDLRHCKDHQCLMHYCRSIADVDSKTNQFCRYCRVLLADQLKKCDAAGPAPQPEAN